MVANSSEHDPLIAEVYDQIKDMTVKEAILFVKKLQVERIREAHSKLVEEVGPMVGEKVDRAKAVVRVVVSPEHLARVRVRLASRPLKLIKIL
ncbi:hypothetical protein Pmar_PMAR027896 [Perkinsus marinus ATCC 50983]|uniref:Uncharacterized protein n=1 Tax=Perkinsus marinus (strain ATCC 50983 / TXsc) TaxID=423536 RepID=C5LDC3_PERM5|nr:hypothetical protein Pmar_PMAR027896 [Perkinsus marinus ATCC 50983]EER05255.1 hypothetical protein Pmar_PMAR027896 [Perkinsus marinus ATCC 50983]|eukprot:XP_002773439.1 hypothetical protein Pmar_PMAR027896 [Perkinsus marinus ATCC 50983]